MATRSSDDMTPQRRLRAAARAGVQTMVVVLPVFWSVGQLAQWQHAARDTLVFAVMLAVALPRALRDIAPREIVGASLAYVVAVCAAVGCGTLLTDGSWRRAAGAVAFSLVVAVPVWARRWTTGRSYGLAASVPFPAILVQPVPPRAGTAVVGWMLVAALIALTWALAITWLSRPSGATAPTTETPASTPASRAASRMALQLAVAVAGAFAVAEAIDPGHIVWTVLTALLVSSGNRGRGDVLWKGAQRLVGAAAATAAATAVATGLHPGDSRAIVAIFAILAVAAALRGFGYVFWSIGVTAALAFLYGYSEKGGTEVLVERLLGVACGGLVAILAAWVILPIRTVDVIRVRVGNARRAAAELTQALDDGGQSRLAVARLRAAARELETVVPTARAARWLGIGAVRRAAASVDQARDRIARIERELSTVEDYGSSSSQPRARA
jgi:hypothetical protein